MDQQTLFNLALVVMFVLVGGVFAATELALVSLRESQLSRMESQSARGVRVAAVARNPNRFLAAVQIGVTVAGFLSAAYGGSTLAPDFAPYLVDAGLPEGAADTTALVLLTLFIAYLSLVFGELVPKRFALQRSAQLSLLVAPPLDRFATAMRPVIWLLSISTNAVVRLLGGDPHAVSEDISEEELRDLVSGHESLGEDERRFVNDVFLASQRTVKEVMRPRGDVVYLKADRRLSDSIEFVRQQPYSRYPVADGGPDQIEGFVHVRDLYDLGDDDRRRVRDVMRPIVMLPSTNQIFPAITTMRSEGTHMALVVDEYGGTDGIVTLEDLVEELIGEIRDEHDAEDVVRTIAVDGSMDVEGGLNIEDFAAETGVELEDGPYETVAGFIVARLGHLPGVGDAVVVEATPAGASSEVAVVLRVEEVDRYRIARVRVERTDTGEPPAGEVSDPE
ncbi:hemolysin family protein [Aeromicrobium marinum]|uniref:hemolysin family protein n=1 Tax=Aeromicrobium marinum TaxID=219314 RepID=UPI0001BCE401|nr:hemolysin family protein [Aeromicrobium marinum]